MLDDPPSVLPHGRVTPSTFTLLKVLTAGDEEFKEWKDLHQVVQQWQQQQQQKQGQQPQQQQGRRQEQQQTQSEEQQQERNRNQKKQQEQEQEGQERQREVQQGEIQDGEEQQLEAFQDRFEEVPICYVSSTHTAAAAGHAAGASSGARAASVEGGKQLGSAAVWSHDMAVLLQLLLDQRLQQYPGGCSIAEDTKQLEVLGRSKDR